jgi:glycosyltransferase involved in cell wall biosynthesis
MKAAFVSVVVPARDEEDWIVDCLASIVAQDYPHDLLEVIVVVDGMSTDATDVLAKEFLDECDFARTEVVRNPHGGTPANLNTGLSLARGEVLCRVDARSRIPRGYVRRCVSTLERSDVVVVGGAQVAVPPGEGALARGIARALNNRYAMGWSRYRRAAASGESDTVYLGAFRTGDLRSIGSWAPRFTTNQDFELNRRLAKHGVVWFDAEIPVDYVPRRSLAALFRQYRRFGRAKVQYWRHTRDRPRPRQALLLVGVPIVGAGGLVAMAFAPRRFSAAAVAVGVAFLVEELGTSGPPGGPRVRTCAVAAMGMVAAGWLVGAWTEAVGPSRNGR